MDTKTDECSGSLIRIIPPKASGVKIARPVHVGSLSTTHPSHPYMRRIPSLLWSVCKHYKIMEYSLLLFILKNYLLSHWIFFIQIILVLSPKHNFKLYSVPFSISIIYLSASTTYFTVLCANIHSSTAI